MVALGHQAQSAQQRQQATTILLLQAARADQVGIFQFAALQQQSGHALVGAGSRVVQGGIHRVGTAAAGRL
jgi:predicted DCC family thiol-disulfide oxidoreductase YuxK